mmetsp:Transcript_26478/g.39208  ORF Transcript_26478/g.39208 Transcript_26478/m.39208 type:complete len:215 (+) Transcript_26478:118-762(+)
MTLANRTAQFSRDILTRSLKGSRNRRGCSTTRILQTITSDTSTIVHQQPHPLSYRTCNGTAYQQFSTSSSSPPIPAKQKKQRGFIPRKAPLNLKPKAREFLKLLLDDAPPDIVGILLRYQPATDGKSMRMVFSFDFARAAALAPNIEGVSLELLQDGSPKTPIESESDGLKKLYIHESAFMKVLGATMDIQMNDDGSFMPTFKDREGNDLDPNA